MHFHYQFFRDLVHRHARYPDKIIGQIDGRGWSLNDQCAIGILPARGTYRINKDLVIVP